MHTIIYISEYQACPDNPTENVLADICQVAIENNLKLNITGVMLFHNNHFLQVLEGEQDALISTFDKIKSDTRHRNLEIIYDEKVNNRCFPNWRMTLFDLNNPEQFTAPVLKQIKTIYSHNFEFKANDFLFLLNSLLNDKELLDAL